MYDQRLRDLGVTLEDATEMHDFEDLVRRAHRHVAVRRAGVVAATGCVVAAIVFAAVQVGDPDRRTDPVPADRSGQSVTWCAEDGGHDCLDIDGWIVYGGTGSVAGIWAVDPGAPDGGDLVQVSERGSMVPLEWSSDGRKLLVRRWSSGAPEDGGLVVLTAEGREIEVVEHDGYAVDGSFSPDGSQVVYAWYGSGGIHVVDADGGAPRLLRAAVSRSYPGEKGEYLGELYNPVYSPDGTRIAYFDGMGDWGHSLRVMRSDGTGIRVLREGWGASHVDDLAWSPDGSRLMFAFQEGEGGIWTIGADGSDLTQVVREGVNPSWSPNGTRIAYQRNESGGLLIADATGENVTSFGHGGSGPWNPLPLDR